MALFNRHTKDLVRLDLQLLLAFLSYTYNHIIDLMEAINVVPKTEEAAKNMTSTIHDEGNVYELQAQVFRAAMAWISSRVDKSQSSWKEDFLDRLKGLWPYVHVNMLCEGDFAKSMATAEAFPRYLLQGVFPSIEMAELSHDVVSGLTPPGTSMDTGKEEKDFMEQEPLGYCETCLSSGYQRKLVHCPACAGDGCRRCYFNKTITVPDGCCKRCIRGDVLMFRDFFHEEFKQQHLRVKTRLPLPSPITENPGSQV